MEKKQTAIDLLEKLFYTHAESTGIDNDKWVIREDDLDKLFEQTKKMEKEQIGDAYQEGKWDWHNHITNGTESKDLAQYYNETYNNPE
jgi:hypothetical protein